ncbi:replicative helicase loader/inhibitor [Petroclostridium sp. X23]|uniref:replicative helicase loader/inhibitor n=1 Tax=Petroclostridium sp. X23 TaxID=3045146 RepID=UPI0024AE4AA7|nr:replicative helicase loader/inhibitor [Petroclostridium sp. X23]WHH59129.1 replicative helicase loader/inhibitor [Petroclostridium sp. X23]
MVKSEIAKILAVIAAAYPKFEIDEIKQNVWHEMLGDIDYKIAQLAVKKLLMESPFPPAISDIRKQVAEIITPSENQINAADAWGEVVDAMRRYGYYRETEAIQSLSPLTAKVVNYIGFREICLCEEPGVIRGQFLKMFEQVANRERRENLLPENLKSQIQLIASKGNLKLVKSIAE